MTKTVKLGETATFINGYPFKPSDWKDEGLPIIRIQNLTGNAYETNYFDGKVPAKYYVQNGDVLISWSASLGIYDWQGGNAVLNQHIFKVVFDKLHIDKQYFKRIVSHKLNAMAALTHGATMKHITKGDFDNMPIPLPTLPEQRRIAALLDRADALRQKDRQLLTHYDALAQSVFLDLFGDPVRNEKGWEVKQFDQLGKLDRGVSKHRPRNDPKLLGGPYPLIQTGDVANAGGYIIRYKSTYSELGLKQSRMWKAGTLCITIAANIAKTSILNFDACFPDSVVGFTPEKAQTNSEYIRFWLSFLQKILEDSAPESAQKNINLEILRNLSVPVPPLPLQQQFAAVIERIERQKAVVRQQMAQSEALFGRLLQESFGA